ncbi:hypothetical protein A2U01_0099036, partial [Trifolium medium]|nr:hypothetical protein [Trifolium medium]
VALFFCFSSGVGAARRARAVFATRRVFGQG